MFAKNDAEMFLLLFWEDFAMEKYNKKKPGSSHIKKSFSRQIK